MFLYKNPPVQYNAEAYCNFLVENETKPNYRRPLSEEKNHLVDLGFDSLLLQRRCFKVLRLEPSQMLSVDLWHFYFKKLWIMSYFIAQKE